MYKTITNQSLQPYLGAINQNLIPETDNTYDIGSTSLRWRNGYFGGNLKSSNFTATATSNQIQILPGNSGNSITFTATNPSANRVITIPDPKANCNVVLQNINSGLTNNSNRPAITTTTAQYEIRGFSSGGIALDDGFLRLRSGGGTTVNTVAAIELSGYSNVGDMNSNIVFYTSGTRQASLDNAGIIHTNAIIPNTTLTYSFGSTDFTWQNLISANVLFCNNNVNVIGLNADTPVNTVYYTFEDVSSNGKVMIADANPNMGYSQLTSNLTGVSIFTRIAKITMFTTVPSATAQSFTLTATNLIFGASSNILVFISGSGAKTSGNVPITVSTSSQVDNSVIITVSNGDPGAASNAAPVINVIIG